MGSWGGSYGDCKREDSTCIQQHARFAIEDWLHIGGTHIDTANDYRTQTAIGGVLASSGLKREDLFITTKCPGTIGYEATIQCADDNLQMLGQFGTHGVGYLDLLLVHFPGKPKPECRFKPTEYPMCSKGFTALEPADKAALQDTWRAMEELKRIGVVKAIGVSDYNTTHLSETLEAATMPIEVHQVEWNPSSHDEGMLDFCKKNNILLQAWSPLGGSHGSVLGEDAVKTIAAAHNVSTAQAVLRWSLQRGVAVVVGSANADHIAGDLDLFSFTLTDDEVSTISKLHPSVVQI